MKFEKLVELCRRQPVFEAGFLAASVESVAALQVQLCRWVAAGKVEQLRRGVYCLAAPYRQTEPHPFVVANVLSHGSYVSCQSALHHWGCIPDVPWSVTSVTPGRTEQLSTPLGRFLFRHAKQELVFGYQTMKTAGGLEALVAFPEKALLDLAYYTPKSDGQAFLKELRLDTADGFDVARLVTLAERSNSPKLRRVASRVADFVEREG